MSRTIRTFLRALANSLLTLIAPGLGQWRAGRTKRAVFFAIAVPVSALLYAHLVPRGAVFFKPLTLLFSGLALIALVDAFVATARALPPPESRDKRWFLAFAASTAALATGLYQAARIRTFEMPADYMMPTIISRDRMVTDTEAYSRTAPKRGDIVAFRFPRDPELTFIRRIVAIAGDVVESRNGVLFLNGAAVLAQPLTGPPRAAAVDRVVRSHADRLEMQQEDFDYVQETLGDVSYVILLSRKKVRMTYGPVTVPPASVWALGDNRDFSNDSPHFGFVPVDHLISKYLYTFASPR